MAQDRDERINFIYAVTGSDEVAASAAAMLKVADAGENASKEVLAFAAALTTASTQSKLAQEALSQKAGLAQISSDLDKAKDAYGRLNAQLITTGDSSKKASTALAAAGKAVDDLTIKQNLATVALTKTEGALTKVGGDAKDLAGSFAKANAAGAEASKGLASIGDAAAKAADGTKKTADATKSLGEESSKSSGLLEELKSHLLAIVSTATLLEAAFKGIEFGKESIAGAAGVEQTLSRIKATAEGAAEQFGQLDKAIEEAARAANVSNQAAAAAALALAQQGESAAQIFQTLLPTILLAKDANIDYATSAKIVDDILDLFGKDASEAGAAVDALVVASKGSKEGLQGMAEAISGLAPDAKQLGLSFETLVGTLGFLQQNGIDASKAVRGLRTVFQDLENPASALTQKLAELGDTSQDFGKAIATIRDGGQKGQEALLSLSGAARSLVAFLAQQAPDAVDKFTAALSNSTGAAKKTQEAIDKNLTGSFTKFENAIDALGEKLATPILKPLADEFAKLANQINAFADSDQFAAIATQVGKLATDIVKAFDGIVSGIDWDTFVSKVQTAVTDAGDSLHTLADNATSVATSINKIAAALGAVAQFGSVGFRAIEVAFGATATATAAAADVAVTGIDKLRGKTSELGATLDAATLKGAAFTKTALQGGSEAAQNLAGDLVNLGTSATGALDSLKTGADGVAPAIKEIGDASTEATDATKALGEVGPGVFENTAAAANAAAKAVSDHNKAILEAEAAVDKAHKAFQDLVASGNGSAEAMLAAKKAYDDAAAALDKLRGKTDETTDAQNKLKIAFAGLHITSQKDLEDAANAAKTNLDLITEAFRANGAKIEDVRRAYDAYAASVRAAFSQSDSIVREQQEDNLKLLASTLGLATGFKSAGDSGEDAGKRTASAYDKTTESVAKAAAAIKDASDASKKWAQEIDDFSTSANAWGDSLAAAATKAASAQEGVTLQTNEQLRLLREARDEWLSGALNAEQYAERVKVALGGVDEALLRQEQILKDFNSQINDLQSQLASANGDDTEVENLRHAKKIADIQAETDLSSAQRRKLEDLEEQIHEANLRRIKQENDARNAGNPNAPGGGGGTNPNAGGTGDGSGGGSGIPGGGGTQPRSPTQAPQPTLHIEIKADTIIGGTPKQVADQLAKLIFPSLQQIQRRST